MIKGVTKNLQATSPTCNSSPVRESMQSSTNLGKNPTSENLTSTASMATALVTTNSTTVSLSDSSHSGYLNGDLSVESKALKLTFKRNKAPSDTASIPSPSTKPDENSKNHDPPLVPGAIITMHNENPSLHRHPTVNGKILPVTSSSSVSHSVHGEQTRSCSKRTSGSSANSKRPKSASKRDRNATNKPVGVMSLNASNSLVNGRSSSNERNHDPYQFSVKKEDETILPPKKLRLDSSLSRLSERSESHKDQATNTRNQGTSVDADLLGPCEPGTHINLDGYVCLETLTGMLMVSVMWRGRTYLGTLIDSSSHGFSPPIPPSYVYASHRYVSGMDASGASSSSSVNGRNQRGRGKRRCGFAPTSGARHSRKGRRNPRGSPVTVTSSGGPSSSQSLLGGDDSNEETQSRGESPASENALDDEESIMRYQCPQTGCHKRFKEVKAMKFHHDECHTKKTVSEPCSDSESREKPRSKSAKSAGKSKKHSANSGASLSKSASSASLLGASSSSVKSELSSSLATPHVGGCDNVAIKSEGVDSDIPTGTYFKAPVNNGLGSPPVFGFSPSSPSVPSLPNSPANGLKLVSVGGNSNQHGPPEILPLPLHSSSSSTHTTKSLSQTQPQQQLTPAAQQQSDLSVRIPATNNLMVRVGVSSSSGGATITSNSVASVNSSSTSRTVAAVTVPVTTIPVMKPSTVASSSSSSSTLVNCGKKISGKDSKGGGSGGSCKSSGGRASSHSSGTTISASSVTVPRATSPSAQVTGGGQGSSLKPIQPKPQTSTASSPNSSVKAITPSGVAGAPSSSSGMPNDAGSGKRPSSSAAVNPNRKRKKSSGVPTEGNGKRQSIASCPAGSRTAQAKLSLPGFKGRSGSVDADGQGGAEGCNSNQGDRASPAYSDISDDNESPIPILEKEGDVKVLGDSVASGDEVGKASEQASGGGAFYNTPPSLVPFSVYSGEQATPVGNAGNRSVGGSGGGGGGGGNNASCGVGSGNGSAVGGGSGGGGISTSSSRPGSIVGKKGGSPSEPSSGNQVRSTATVIPGTSPLPLTAASSGPPLKRMDSSGRAKATDLNGSGRDLLDGPPSSVGDGAEKAVEAKNRVPSRGELVDEAARAKKTSEPPNLTKISSSLSLSLPSSSTAVSSTTTATTVAKPTPLNPLSPSRSSSEIPASAPAVVTPGALVGASRSANDLYTARPDHLRTPPSFHPGPPFGPGAAAAAAAQFAAAHMSPSGLAPQPPFPPYTPEALMRFVPNGPPPGHPFSGYPYGEPFFGGPAVSSAPQPHKIHELVEKGAVSCASTSASPCTSTATSAACSGLVNKSSVGVDAANALDLQTAKSLADMAVAMRHHASMVPNHSGLPQGPTHAGMVPAHFQYGGAIPPAHMTGPPFAAMQQHSLPPGHPPGHGGPDPFFSPSSIMNHPLYK